MKIAILGANSQIARDLIGSMVRSGKFQLDLYSRKKDVVAAWVVDNHFDHCLSLGYDEWTLKNQYSAIINFVGVGDPARAKEMGSSILEITQQYDDLALNYVKVHPLCKYIFISSGAAYGSDFTLPADESTTAKFPINHLGEQDWYGIAKFYAETKHRALSELPIVDVRVFNYFSVSQDLSAKFFICDIIRAIKNNETLLTSSQDIVRDYIGEEDFFQLIYLILHHSCINTAVDCYTKGPSSKFNILETISNKYSLKYIERTENNISNITGEKTNYYSKNKMAELLSYKPKNSSIENLLNIINRIINYV